jgi:hypothetical protein
MSKSKVKGCFKYSCFGCTAIIALSVGITLLIAAIQLTSDQTPKVATTATAHELPKLADAVFPGADQTEFPDVELEQFPTVPPEMAAGTLILDLTMGDFNIRPGPAGQPIRVEADYDANSFHLTESFTSEDDGAWTYDVNFSGKGGLLGMLFRGGGNVHNNVDIIIPRGHPIRIVGKISKGESEIDLGGLWVEEVDLEAGMGDHFIEFSEPTPFPMRSFNVESSMGSVEIRSLGEASPAEVHVEHSMGEMLLDLDGAWRNDSDVRVKFGMGECRIWVPQDVHADIDRVAVALGERRVETRDESNLPADAPTLTINASGSMGEVRIEN